MPGCEEFPVEKGGKSWGGKTTKSSSKGNGFSLGRRRDTNLLKTICRPAVAVNNDIIRRGRADRSPKGVKRGWLHPSSIINCNFSRNLDEFIYILLWSVCFKRKVFKRRKIGEK